MLPELRATDLLHRLMQNKIEFVVIGGMACIMHGASYVTEDLDVCVSMHPENLGRLLTALEDLDPRLRHRPDRLPLPRKLEDLVGVKNLYLVTRWGKFDLLGELPGIGDFQTTLERSTIVDVEGLSCRLLDLDTLIEVKKYAGRRKDLLVLLELEAIREKIRNRKGTP